MARGPIRVLFVARSIAHFSYFESVVAALLDRGADLELAFDEQWSRSWSGGDQTAVNEFRAAYPSLKTSWSVRRSDPRRDRIFALRELRSFRSYLTRSDTTPYYVNRWRAYLNADWKAKVEDRQFCNLLKSPLGDLSLRLAESLTPPDAGILQHLREMRPDVIVLSPLNMRYSEETDYLKAARRLGIPTALPVLSWDNLSTKGLIQIAPDKIFVWNEFQYEDAIRIHGLPSARIAVAGSPFFDKWFDRPDELPSREAFCKTVGLDPRRKILLYLGSSRNIAADETWFVEEMAAALAAAGADLSRAQILVRPHPANAKIYKRLEGSGVTVWPPEGALPETRQDFADMRCTFHHADAAIGINTTGMVDAVVAGLPTFTVRIPRYGDTQSDSKHFRYLVEGDALYVMDDLLTLQSALAKVWDGRDAKIASRLAFAKLFARPCGLDRSAGDVVAEGVLALAKRQARVESGHVLEPAASAS